MIFARSPRRPARPALLAVVAATALTAGGVLSVNAPAVAQGPPPPPPLHNVKYSVFAEQPFYVDIYYRDVDPPNWAAYSHNPYEFSPKVQAQVGPDQQWNLDVQLADPNRWAMVTATSGPGEATPNIHCVLAVDGVVVATHQGPKGALCSIRNW
ncbi:hypothetical protein [Mycolicibacterium celeriflavum]|uniref:Uncharacterized protein n=1 Tax=Mycolicibacterium celeriflavum TaxID=1249101 RepID=A0A1X0BNG9_MYCCF|nr:hypothetical protein [Mycolicibacterium celeriflavum]MCV7239771.1 hypothetical protein [Mycolicibacterium celeriflavum]ORA44525.1 hypothetical protein BST21_19365 [Mycolicibacterium celeriflavum]BBY41753.1 hypothetical protein MCEL_00480 [Mycolicibacterium celeriflavum]